VLLFLWEPPCTVTPAFTLRSSFQRATGVAARVSVAVAVGTSLGGAELRLVAELAAGRRVVQTQLVARAATAIDVRRIVAVVATTAFALFWRTIAKLAIFITTHRTL